MKNCACAFVPLLIPSLSVQYRHTVTVKLRAVMMFVRQYLCSITAAVPAALTWRSCQCVTPTWRTQTTNLQQNHYCEQRCSCDQIKNNALGGACSTYGEIWGVYRVLVRKLEGKRPLGRLREDGKIILRWSCSKWNVGVWTGSSWLRIWTSGGLLWMR